MNLAAIKAAVTSKAARKILLTQKYSPQILLAAGAIGFVGTVVLACRATLKAYDILDEHEKRQQDLVNADDLSDHTTTADDLAKASHRLQVKTAIEIGKQFLPAIGLGVVTVGALTGSHVILTKRNGALMATAAGLNRAYREYRQRVADEFGEDVDKKLAIGAEDVSIEEKLADGSTKITKTSKVNDDKSGSPYRFCFDLANSRKWSREPGRNALTLVMEQSHMNDRLRANGHLFLNEVLDTLGIPRTKVGAVVGWVYRHDNEEKTGDNYVDFGIYHTGLDRAEAFVDGADSSVFLDFNVDGVILDLI